MAKGLEPVQSDSATDLARRLHQSQRDVLRSEVKYRRLFEAAKDGILILDAKTGAIEEINPFLLELMGGAERDYRGKKLWDIGFFADVELSRAMFEELQSKGYIRYEDLPLMTQNGGMLDVEFVSNVYLSGGRSVIQCNIRDITARKRDESGLRRLASIVESSDDGIYGISLDGRIESWNPACERLYGYTAEEAVGKEITILCPPNLLAEKLELMERVRAGRSVSQHETVRVGKNGKPIDVALSLTQLKDVKGQLVGFCCMARSLTKNKQLEAKLRQSQKMEGIGRLAGGIAHDFNNLLTAIMGYSQFLLENLAPGDPNREDVGVILQAGERAALLTRQLLAFSRQQAVTMKVIDINAMIAELERMLRRIIGEEITLSFVPGEDLGRVKLGPGQIEQIIMNLCVNAKDAMPRGGRLIIETTNMELDQEYSLSHPHSKAGPYVMITISDSGSGMTPEVLTHLFEPFFTTKEQGKGTGLGLSTVYGIVEQAGGSIDVYSEVGYGTTFKILLPRVAECISTSSAPSRPSASYRGDESILLVEDDDIVRSFTSRVLHQNGYKVLVADSPKQAIKICAEHEGPIHLLLTDVVMPEMLGHELSLQLVSIKPGMRVIYMSGYTEQSIIQRAAMQGAAFIQKPMTPEFLLRRIRHVLDGARSAP